LPSASTFRRWLIKYEDGIYDGFLCSMGLVRKSSVIQPTRSVIKRKVLAELVLKDFTKLVSISDTEVLEILVGVEASMGIDHSKRSKSWINNIKLVAQKTKVKEMMEKEMMETEMVIADKVDTSTEMDLVGKVELSAEIDGAGEVSTVLRLKGANLDIHSKYWRGVTPNVRVLENLYEVIDEKIAEKGKENEDTTLIAETISFEENSNESLGRRKYMKGYCFCSSRIDCSKANTICMKNLPEGKDRVEIELENHDSNVTIAMLPPKVADRMRDILVCLYDTKRGGNGVGLSKAAFYNTGSNRVSPRGRMGIFGLKKDGSHYVHSEEDLRKNGVSLFNLLEELEELLHDWMVDNCPDVLSEIQKDNEPTHQGNQPKYIRKGKMISPRMILSSLLGNEVHVDPDDKGLSIVVWLAENPEESTDDWHFILQSLQTTIGESTKDSTLIQLCHGIVMIYDGRYIRHGTTIPNSRRGNKFGFFHGSN